MFVYPRSPGWPPAAGLSLLTLILTVGLSSTLKHTHSYVIIALLQPDCVAITQSLSYYNITSQVGRRIRRRHPPEFADRVSRLCF